MDTDETRIKEFEAEEHPQRLIHRELTEAIIGAAFEVHNVLGYGFLEKVYQRALQAELIRRGLSAETEQPLAVNYKGINVGEYVADLVVEEKVIVELKVAAELNLHDEAQLINELKAGKIRVGLLINFGRTRVEHRRRVI
jgi:GxxExxY protein